MSAIPDHVPAEDAEMWCERCGRRHGVVWFAPSEIWNAVMREGDRGKPDEYGMCCPICFMQLADERGVGSGMWEVRAEYVAPGPSEGRAAPLGTASGCLKEHE